MPYSPSSYEAMKSSLDEGRHTNPYRQRYPFEPSPAYERPRVPDEKLNRLEKIVEKQQDEIELLRAKLDEVRVASASNVGTPVPMPAYYQPPYAPYAPAQMYFNSPPSYACPPPASYKAVPPGCIHPRAYRTDDEADMRPSSAAPFVSRERRHFFGDDYDGYAERHGFWRQTSVQHQSAFRPQSAVDRWGDSDAEFSYNPAQQARNPFENASSRFFPEPDDMLENKPPMDDFRFGGQQVDNRSHGRGGFLNQRRGILPHPQPGQENNWRAARGNFRGSGFRSSGVGRGAGCLGEQARDSLAVMRDSGYPRSSSPNEDYSAESSDTSTNKQTTAFQPRRVTTQSYSNTVSLEVPPRKLKGLVDDSFLSQQNDSVVQQLPVKQEPRPPSSILKVNEMVDDSFDSNNSNGNNGKSVTFKMDQEVAAVLDRAKSPFHPGEQTPSPTSSSSSLAEPMNISLLQPADFLESDSDLRGQVVHVVSPYEFYVVINESQEMADRLQKYAQSSKTRPVFDASKMQEGELCIAKFTDGCWYRAAISYPGKIPEVLLVDYGNMYTIDEPVEENLRVWDKRFAAFPVQGAVAQLAGVAPPGRSTEWAFTSTEEFKRLVTDRVVMVDVVDGNQVPPALRLVDEANGTDIGASLVQLAFAKKS